MICTFCKNKGIPSPHNHTVRQWILPNKPIICPNLLNNICPLCKTKGHTSQYCPQHIGCTKSVDMTNLEYKPIMTDQDNINHLKRELVIEQTDNSLSSNKIQKV